MKKETNIAVAQEKDVERTVGKLLRIGVVTASLIVFIGGVSYLVNFGGLARPDYHNFKGEDNSLVTFTGIFNGLFLGQAKGIIQFGVMLLIFTPILRIIFSLFSFIVEKDRMYVMITLVVLVIIMGSTFGGLNI